MSEPPAQLPSPEAAGAAGVAPSEAAAALPAETVAAASCRSSSLPLEAAATLCARCRYNLHGLPEDGLCPECALPIRASRDGTPLHHYPPQWLNRVAGGVMLLAVGTWAVAGLRLALVWNVIPYTSKVAPGDFPTARAAAIVINVLILIANWMTAAPQPQAHEDAFSIRRMVRVIAVVMLALYLLGYTGLMSTRVDKAAYYSASDVVELAGLGFLTLYLRRLAALLGRPGLGLQMSVAFVGWGACVVAGNVAFWIADLLRLTLWRHLPLPRLALAEAAWWPFTIYLGVVLLQFRFAFLSAARGRE